MDYAEWIDGIFNRLPVNEFELDWSEEFSAKIYGLSPTEEVRLIVETLENCGRDLAHFSDEQIAGGLGFFLWSTGYCGCGFYDMSVPAEDKRRMVAGISALYRDIFAVRCDDCDANRSIENPLNFRCYMLWDAGRVGLYGLKEQGEAKKILEDAVFDVLEKALYLPHYGCRQSALHGLGHIHCEGESCPERVEWIIDRFLQTADLDEELREYAACARAGWVQ